MLKFLRNLIRLVNHGDRIMASLNDILSTEQSIGTKIDQLAQKVDALKAGQADPAKLEAIAATQADNVAKLNALNDG